MTTPKNQKPAAAKAASETQEASAAEQEAPAATGAVLQVEAISEQGRFRAGYRFTREAQQLPLADLTKEQIRAIKADPMLRVKEVA